MAAQVVTLSTGRKVTVEPPAGLARIRAQAKFDEQFAVLAVDRPTDPEGIRREITRVGWAVARYVTDATPQELIEIFYKNPGDLALVLQIALGE